MSKLLAIAWNHIRIEFEDRSTIVFFLILPLLFTVIVGSALSGDNAGGDTRPVVAVADLDRSAFAQEFLAALQGSKNLRAAALSQAEADRAFEDDQAIGVLVISPGFEAAALNGQPIDLNLRVANDNQALAVEQEVRAILEQTSGALVAARAAVREAEKIKPFADEQTKQAYFNASLKTAQGLLKNPPARLEATQPQTTETVEAGEGFQQSSPGQLVTWVMTTLFGVAGFLVYERINGTARRMAVMPMRNSIILGGNFAGRFGLGIVQMILMVGFGAVALNVPYGNDPLALAVMLIAFGLAGTAFGLMLGTFSRTMSQAGGLSILFAMLFAALGGCWWPLEITPPIYQTIVKALPSTWAMQGLSDIILYGRGLSEVWLNVVVLLAFAAIFFAVGVRRLRLD
ncbi:Linearmycin resistance permease protein LnrN [Thermoflexales bacterium]|nr:Linearmycin resistance permease protein LnrN [Thermoflexales bacterium]